MKVNFENLPFDVPEFEVSHTSSKKGGIGKFIIAAFILVFILLVLTGRRNDSALNSLRGGGNAKA